MIIIRNYRLLCCLLVLMSCTSQDFTMLEIAGDLPNSLNESSGVVNLRGSDNFWMINDSGNTNELFEVSETGAIQQIITVENAKNKDWEDLASDGRDNIFIGDFGNNNNKRKNLGIYTVAISSIKNGKVKAVKTKFHFEDQKKFPPKKKDRNFDVEAFVYAKGYFYLFTKNRSSEFNGITKLYKVPSQPGNHSAELIGSFETCMDSKKCAITAATISRNNEELVLLTHDKLFLFTNFKGDDFFNGSVSEINLYHDSQKEAVCFKGGTIYITDEATKKSNGNLYRVVN